MTNTDILNKLESLFDHIFSSKLDDKTAHYPDDIEKDIKDAIKADNVYTKINLEHQDNETNAESYDANVYQKLIFDYYLPKFDFKSATPEEIEKVANFTGRLIDQITYKGIPYKNLSEYHLFDIGLSDIYHTVHLDRTYTHLSNFVQQVKGQLYPAMLKILIKNNCLDVAAKFYKSYSFYISPRFLILSTKEFYDTEEKIQQINKNFASLLICELEKLDISIYKLQIEESDESTCNYLTFRNLFDQIRYILGKACYSDMKFSKTYSFGSLYPNGVQPDIFDSISIYLLNPENDKNIKNIINSFIYDFDDLSQRFNKKIISDEQYTQELRKLFARTSSQGTSDFLIGEDIELLLRVMLYGCIYLILDSEDLMVTPSKLVSAYLKQKSEVRKFIADLIDLYVNIKNFRSDIVDPNNILSFIDMLENHYKDLEEKEINAKTKAITNNFKNLPIDDNCKSFFNDNRDGENQIIDYSTIYEKLNGFDDIKKIISTGEIIFMPYREMDENVLSGDLTGLVACQIKAVERYLKEVIVNYAKANNKNLAVVTYAKANNKNLADVNYAKANNQNLADGNNKIIAIDKDEKYIDDKISINGYRIVKRKIVTIKDESNAMSLSSIDSGCAHTEIGSCITFIKDNIIPKEKSNSIFYYSYKISKCKLYSDWVNVVRNPHMHVKAIENLTEAKKTLAKTAYWLLKIIDELGG